MRVLHSADIHLGELPGPVINGQNARLLDTLRCLDFMVEYAERERPDVILIAGDLFDKSKLWADNMLILINAVADKLADLSKVAPTVVMFGTDNHDNKQAFENLKSMSITGLRIVTEPGVYYTNTQSGPLQIACIPGLDKGYFRTKFPAMAPAEESLMCSQLLGDMVNGLSAQLDPSIPSVLMAHYTVVGCELDNGQHVFTQSEVVLPKEALAGSAFDLVCLGHIHRAQQVECAGKPVFYSGPVNGITFNEEGQDKGFWMHEIGPTLKGFEHVEIPTYLSSEFIKTPSREFLTIKWDDKNVENYLNYSDADPAWFFGTGVTNKIIRIHYSCSDELNKQLNRKALEKSLYEAGAFHVAEIKPERIISTLVKQELTETSGPLENLTTWLTAEGVTPEEITAILNLSRPLIATISAKMPTGTLSGVFEPRSLTVRNYRSYLSESLNFKDIYFATVNGKNGIGKSAFFMDAVRDCLFEEPRTGITGSWITNGQNDGMIDFEFSMGATEWRVIRNRSVKGSGKITLALQERITDNWENRSGTTTRETQEKIESLLGMDCATFSCTALIMQDAYGLFMEADKEARMGVLANILGLGVYEQLADLAKVKVSELNKSLVISKAKLAELDEKLKGKAGLETALKTHEADINLTVGDIAAKEIALKAAEELVRTLKAKIEKAEDLQKQVAALNAEIFDKRIDIVAKRQVAERAQKMLANEVQILAKAEEYLRVKDQVLVLETKNPKLQELNDDRTRVSGDLDMLLLQVNMLSPQIVSLEKVLASKPELDLAAKQYERENVRLSEMDVLATKANDKNQEILEAEKDTDRTGDEIYDKRLVLKEAQETMDRLVAKTAMLEKSNCIDPKNAKCAFLADAQKAKAQIPFVEQSIASIEKEIADMVEARKPFVKIVEDLDAQYRAIGYDIHDGKEHRALRELIKSLLPKTVLAGQLDSKAELLEGLRVQDTDIRKRVEVLQEQLRVIIQDGATLNAEISALPALQERLPKLLQWVSAKEELPAARQIVSSTDDIIKGIEADIAAKGQQIREIEFDIEFMKVEKDEMSSANVKVSRAQGDLEWLKGQQLDYTSKIGALTAQIAALAKDDTERKRIADDMAPTAKYLTHYQTLSKAFGNDGIPFSIVRSVVPELSSMANDILGQMTGGQMALEIKTERVQKSSKKEVNAIEVWIMDWRGNIPYGDRSGGQKVKAALANAFALADLKARRVGIQLGMMWIDEPPFLDSEGTEAYCDALEQLNVRNQNMKVIAISHDMGMKARFPQQIEVVDMGEEGSKVKLVS